MVQKSGVKAMGLVGHSGVTTVVIETTIMGFLEFIEGGTLYTMLVEVERQRGGQVASAGVEVEAGGRRACCWKVESSGSDAEVEFGPLDEPIQRA